MTIGNLQVTAVTIRGLTENGVHKPQWNQSLSLPIPESKTTLYLEVVNENPSDAGVIGRGSYDFSPVVYQNERLDDIWVPIYSTNNGTSTVGHVLIRLDKQHTQQQQQQQQQGGGPPAYSGSFGSNDYPQEKQQPPTYDRQSSFASLGPDQPLPENYGTGNPPPFTPPATSSNDPPAYPTSSYAPPQAGGYAMPGVPQPEQTSQQGQKEKEKSTDWMKIGLGAAAALGVGAFAAHEYKEHQEEKHHQHKN
ncbi:unnamed protein product [Absidia cylindrospora]